MTNATNVVVETINKTADRDLRRWIEQQFDRVRILAQAIPELEFQLPEKHQTAQRVTVHAMPGELLSIIAEAAFQYHQPRFRKEVAERVLVKLGTSIPDVVEDMVGSPGGTD